MDNIFPRAVKINNSDEPIVIKTLTQYVYDFKEEPRNKGCIIEVLNKEELIRTKGIDIYSLGIKKIGELCINYINVMGYDKEVSLYTIDHGTFYLACEPDTTAQKFKYVVNKIFNKFQFCKDDDTGVAAFARFILVIDSENPLQEAYDLMVSNKDNGALFLSNEELKGTKQEKTKEEKKELEVIEFLNKSIKNDWVIPYYQGIRDNNTGKISKYEALMRIEDHDGNIYSPGYFMDIAKKYHMYLEISALMITKVIDEFDGRKEEVSINISYADIFYNSFRNWLIFKFNTLKNPTNFTIEITETDNDALGSDVDSLLDHCRNLGMKIAIDDYGTGYSTLARIIELKPDYIKIDGSIVERVVLDQKYKTLLESATLMAQGCKAKVIAEFVKNMDIQEEIERIGIDYSQGYYYSIPKPLIEL